MIEHYSINDFSRKFCFNNYREWLFQLFEEEIENLLRQSEKLRIIVFGSFITNKEKPSDIDVLISIIPNRDYSYIILKKGLPRLHKEKVDVQYSKHQYFLESCESLIKTFNKNKLNKKDKIVIEDAVEVVLAGESPSCN
jgi:predicted nucleotidyltransferase